MANKWTDEQLSAITTAPNTLVSAAAGSGKTAVLVERIIRKLIPDQNGNASDITRLLVVTFARDAAGEMQERIKKALNNLMHDSKDAGLRRHYKTQLKLVGQADITTIDAFCINAVRRNFHFLDIDPAFRIMDKSEADILKAELADELFSRKYEEDDENFLYLNKLYSSVSSDYELIKLLLKLYEFTRSLPAPDEWLNNCISSYEQPFSDSFWEKYALRAKNSSATDCELILKKASDKLDNYLAQNNYSSPDDCSDDFAYLYKLTKNALTLCKNLRISDYDKAHALLSEANLVSPAKSRKKNDLAIFINEIIDDLKKGYDILNDISSLFTFDSAGQQKITKRQHKVVSALVHLCREFSELVFKAKLERNMYEFNDLEHMCLRLLTENPLIAEEYKSKYDEVLMDEYQDTNGLQEAIFEAVSKENNRFMVGDMKQSIYRFRSSDPMIFKSKLGLYSTDKTAGIAISLTKNFRSREEVLASVNDIFKSTMYEDTAEIEYDSSQQLNCGNLTLSENKYRPDIYKSEFHIIESSDNDEDSLQATEARYVAAKIRNLLDSDFKVFDSGEFRQLKKSDIAILSTAVKTLSDDYVRILSDFGIEASIQCGGFLDRSEIRLVCCIMSIICNPRQDIPLISVLRSPVFSFTDDKLAEIRLCCGGNFFDALKEYTRIYNCEQCNSFLSTLNSWRELSKYTDSNRLLWAIYTKTGLYDIAGILYDSDAQANLRLLTEMAKTYESGGYKGIYNFSAYIERLKKNEVDIESVSSGSDTDSVKIMTIHKSKGLEFPVVFLVGACKKFNNDISVLAMHKDFGLALPYSDYETRKTASTLQSIILNKIKSQENTAECMRRLYVALTRAKEKLIITGAASRAAYDEYENYKSGGIVALKNRWSSFNFDNHQVINSASAYSDWIAPCAIKSDNWKFIESEVEDVSPDTNQINTEDKEYTDYITQDAINSLLERQYNSAAKSDVPSRMYVTQLKNFTNQTPELRREPDFMHEKSLSGAKIGDAYHTVLSNINTAEIRDLTSVIKEIDRICTAGYISKLEQSYINPEKIYALFETEIGKEMLVSELKRETPFELMIPAGEIFEDTDGEILIQGIIDCWFYNKNGDIVLIDYKSDYVKDVNELKKKYDTQIKWYQKALESILQRNVCRRYIYSISKSTWIEL